MREIFARRREQGEYHNLVQELRQCDPESHFRYLRMSKETFDSLLAMVSVKQLGKVIKLQMINMYRFVIS